MAMAVTSTFVPDDISFELLGRLRGPLNIFGDVRFNGPIELWLTAEDGYSVALRSDYNDVRFKFENFGFIVVPGAKPDEGIKQLGHVKDWQELIYLFQFEWERPTGPGEVPAGYEQIIQERGKWQDIPTSAAATVVSLVGVIFWSAVQCTPALMISIDEEDPATVKAIDNADLITARMKQGDCIRGQELKAWKSTIQDRKMTAFIHLT